MVILKDLISMLTTGAYANTTFSGTDGVLKEVHYEKVANLINLGNVELHKRFKFLENELTLHVVPDVTKYYLRHDRVATNGAISSLQYIEEDYAADGFLNIIKVTSVYDADGTEIRFNTAPSYNPTNAGTPKIIQLAFDTLQITNVLSNKTLSIVYQAYPNKVVTDDFLDSNNVELNIPDTAIDPLLSFIAAKTFKPMGANDSTANADKSASYEQAYELACQKIDMYGLDMQDTTERDTFVSNGWV